MRVLISQKPMGYSTVKLTLQIDCYHESYRWIKKRRQIFTNHCKPYFLVKPLVTYSYCSKNAIDHRFSMGLPSCGARVFSQFFNIEYKAKINQGNHERPLPPRWHYRSINGKTFPYSPVHRYIHYCQWMPLDKLWQYAKPVKPRLSSLWSLSKDCLKIKGFQLDFCHRCS